MTATNEEAPAGSTSCNSSGEGLTHPIRMNKEGTTIMADNTQARTPQDPIAAAVAAGTMSAAHAAGFAAADAALPAWAQQVDDWQVEYAGPRSKKLTGRSARFVMGEFHEVDTRNRTQPIDVHLQCIQVRNDETGKIGSGPARVELDSIVLSPQQALVLAEILTDLANIANLEAGR